MGLSRAELSILLTDDLEIRDLNLRYRKVDRATDVLSFPLVQPDPLPPHWAGPLGDVVISLETAARQAPSAPEHRDSLPLPAQQWTLADEILFLLIHGLLHLVGYDHEEEEQARTMEEREHNLFRKVREGEVPARARS
ncbi:MAG: rRNA maturation RNase YbeY [Bradymonadales bacterium]|nr:rRNA maturation RNase YbeY [Bradymonadales bacterium]